MNVTECLVLYLIKQDLERDTSLERTCIRDDIVCRVLRYHFVAVGVHVVLRVLRILPHRQELEQGRKNWMDLLREAEQILERSIEE